MHTDGYIGNLIQVELIILVLRPASAFKAIPAARAQKASVQSLAVRFDPGNRPCLLNRQPRVSERGTFHWPARWPGKQGASHSRHTFAVRSLEACRGGKEEVGRHMLALSTYLGHAHPSDTYYYLQATPRIMEDTARAGESWFQGGTT